MVPKLGQDRGVSQPVHDGVPGGILGWGTPWPDQDTEVPQPGQDGGYPSQVGGTPQPGQDGGYPSQVRGYPPARSG